MYLANIRVVPTQPAVKWPSVYPKAVTWPLFMDRDSERSSVLLRVLLPQSQQVQKEDTVTLGTAELKSGESLVCIIGNVGLC